MFRHVIGYIKMNYGKIFKIRDYIIYNLCKKTGQSSCNILTSVYNNIKIIDDVFRTVKHKATMLLP
jgi:hypothetical protein